MSDRTWRMALLVALAGTASACAALAVGGAGAATGVYLESRGASAIIEGTPDQVAARTERVFADLGIRVTERDYGYEDGGEIDIRGVDGDLDIGVDIEPESANTTKVHVEARENLVQWDQDYAKMVVERIVTAR